MTGVVPSTLVNGAYVYWIDLTTSTIKRIPRANPSASMPEEVADAGASKAALVQSGARFHWLDTSNDGTLDGGALYAQPFAGGDENVLATIPPPGVPVALAVSQDAIYVASRDVRGDGSDVIVRRVALADGQVTLVAFHPSPLTPTMPQHIAVDDKHLYYTDNGNQTLWRVPFGAAPDAGAEAIATQQSWLGGVAAD